LLADKNITLTATDAAIEWLGREGYDESFGARPLARVVQLHVRQPASEEILFGELSHGGGTIELDLRDDKLVLNCTRAKPAEPQSEPAKSDADKKLN
jgi:ATP-dependent Clp protease ATP-binding subunit ClpA